LNAFIAGPSARSACPSLSAQGVRPGLGPRSAERRPPACRTPRDDLPALILLRPASIVCSAVAALAPPWPRAPQAACPPQLARIDASFDPVGGALTGQRDDQLTLNVSGVGGYLWDIDLTTSSRTRGAPTSTSV
jgi:hypothetical protein